MKTDPETVCTNVTDLIRDAMNPFLLSKTVTTKTGDKVCFADKCRRTAGRKRRLFKKANKSQIESSKVKFAEARHSYNQVEKQASRNYNNSLFGNIWQTKFWAVRNGGGMSTRSLVEQFALISQWLNINKSPISQQETSRNLSDICRKVHTPRRRWRGPKCSSFNIKIVWQNSLSNLSMFENVCSI